MEVYPPSWPPSPSVALQTHLEGVSLTHRTVGLAPQKEEDKACSVRSEEPVYLLSIPTGARSLWAERNMKIKEKKFRGFRHFSFLTLSKRLRYISETEGHLLLFVFL